MSLVEAQQIIPGRSHSRTLNFVVVGKASEQTMQEQTLSHIVLYSLDRSTTRGVERCLVCIAKCRTTSAVVVIRCLPLNYSERNRGCHLTDSFIGRCKGTGVVRQALLLSRRSSCAVLLALCRLAAVTSTGIF